jgi:endonuclease YncB( thermonuclease family)
MNAKSWKQTIRALGSRRLRGAGGLVALGVLLLVAIGEAVTGWWAGDNVPAVVEGRARVIDGDSLRIGRHEIRLVGIDAPEGRQMCERNGWSYRCGDTAREALHGLVANGVRCDVEKRDQHDRLLATCFAGTTNINRALVTQGTAVRFGNRYRREESEARRTRKGLWAGTFERPSDWRRKNMR